MKTLFFKICLSLVALIFSASAGFSLPDCPSTGYFHNCVGTDTFTNGDKYVGEFQDDKRTGQGTYFFANGNKYVGEFRDGEKNGQGTFTFGPNTVWAGNKYVGEFRDGKKDGQGTFTFGPNSEGAGGKYVGEFRDDIRHGQGTYFYPSGNIYKGDWKDDRKDGQGTFTWPEGDKYVGEWRDDKRNGQGTYTKANGDKYAGEFRDGKKHGQGTQIWANGDKYFGEFREGYRTGNATLFYANGDIYFGEVQNGSRHGLGVYTYGVNSKFAGAIFIGEFDKHKAIEQGIFISNDGNADWCNYSGNKLESCTGTNVYDIAPILLQSFQRLPEHQRKRVQTSLRSQGLYLSSIDGKWGRNTFLGLASYSVLNLKSLNINSTGQVDKLLSNLTFNKEQQQALYRARCRLNPQRCGIEPICAFATHLQGDKRVWVEFGQHKTYAIEAKKFGLTCGVNSAISTVPKQKTCEDDPKLCTVIQLCQKASTTKNGKKVWRNTGAAKSYIALAKGNGVTCNVKEEPVEEKILKVASGTGFFVSPQGHIVTNEHVIDGCTETKVHMKGKMYPSIMLAKDVKNDLALLQISNKPDTYFELNKSNPELLDDIIVAGYPFGNRLSSSLKITRGIVSSESGLADNFSEIQIDAALQPGNSGGPILNEYGNVVGVAVAKLDAEFALEEFGSLPENTNFGIKVSIVKSLLEANEVSFAEGNERQMANKALGKLAKDATVFLSCWMTTAQIEIMRKKKVLFEDLE